MLKTRRKTATSKPARRGGKPLAPDIVEQPGDMPFNPFVWCRRGLYAGDPKDPINKKLWLAISRRGAVVAVASAPDDNAGEAKYRHAFQRTTAALAEILDRRDPMLLGAYSEP